MVYVAKPHIVYAISFNVMQKKFHPGLVCCCSSLAWPDRYFFFLCTKRKNSGLATRDYCCSMVAGCGWSSMAHASVDCMLPEVQVTAGLEIFSAFE